MAASSTIAAIATAPGQGGVGIIRLSGPHALSCARLVAPSLPPELTPRKAYYTSFVDDSGQVWDRGLVLYFAAPSSFTGEEVVELHATDRRCCFNGSFPGFWGTTPDSHNPVNLRGALF